MKKKLALLLAAVVASSGMTVTGFAANFKDINDVPWSGASAIITNAVNRGLLSGYEDNTFRAKNSVTYAEAMQMVYKVMQMTGKASAVSSADISQYSTFLSAYNVPGWSQEAVTYGLTAGILDTTDIAKFVTNGKNNSATREDVGLMFGRAMATVFGADGMAIEAAKFSDSPKISYTALQYIGLLVDKGVVSGDDTNNFNPQKNINRAEMAVMMNKSFDVLESEEGYSMRGEITKFEYDGDTYYISVTFEDDDRMNYTAMPDRTVVYDGNTSKEISLTRLAVGDTVDVIEEGGYLVGFRLIDGTTTQGKYDITGYINSFKGSTIAFENENTGEDDSLDVDSGCIYYVDGAKVTKRTFVSEFEDNNNTYAYAGFITTTKLEKVKDGNSSTREYVTYITEVNAEFSDNYTSTGTLEEMSSNSMSFKAYAGKTSTYKFAEDYQFYIGDTKATASEVEKLLDASDELYAKVTVDRDIKVIKAYFSEDDFATGNATDSTTYTLVDITEKKMIIKSGGDDKTYMFGSTNPTSNIDFYTWDWDDTDADWVKVKDVSKAEKFLLDAEDDNYNTVYCRLKFNSGGKITDVYLSVKKSAWAASEDSSDFVTKKGTVASLDGTTLKFKTTSASYTLLSQYNVTVKNEDNVSTVVADDPNDSNKRVKNPLEILGAQTSSLTVFKKMAASDDVELYTEIRVNSDNVVHAIEARLVEATGTLVKYDKGDREISIETSDGATLNLVTRGTPEITDEVCEAEELEMARYNGSNLLLTFDGKGQVEEIEILDSSVGRSTAKGIVTADGNGVRVAGSSKVYRWHTQDSIIHNNSMDTTQLHYIKQLLGDEDVEVYGAIKADENDRILDITLTVQEASGKFQNYDEDGHTVRIITDAGYKFTFNTTRKPKIDIDDIDTDKLNSKAVDKTIDLTFNSDGLVSSFGN